MQTSFKGIWPALVTPFGADGSVNADEARRLIDYLIEAGVGGFYLCGSTGEGILMRLEERKAFVEDALSHIGGRVPVIAHVGAVATRDAAELAAHAAGAGADAVAAIPPIFFGLVPGGLEAHYRTIAEAAGDCPTFVYYMPSNTHVTLTFHQIRPLLDIEGVAGMKFTDTDLYLMKQAVDYGVNVLSGRDMLLLGSLAMGAHGSVGTNYNIMPHMGVKVFDAVTANDLDTARETQKRMNAVIMLLLDTGNLLGAVNAVLARQGFAVGDPRQPLLPLPGDQAEKLLADLDALAFFDAEPGIA